MGISATLANSSDTVILSNNPQNVLSASIASTLAAGTYTLRVTGTGRNNPLTDGFTYYGSLGYYSITGSVAAVRLPTRLTVPEHCAAGTLVGPVVPISTNSSLAFTITSGNTGNTFSIDSRGTVRVANPTLLDYKRLATNSMFPVQFQLLVNITDLINPALTELNRRVVIAVLDVNDAPVITGFTTSVLEHTRIGTAVGSVSARDPDFGQRLTYSITSGNTNDAFSIDGNGVLSVARDLEAAAQSVYSLAVVASDNVIGYARSATGYVTINVVTNRTPFQPGAINYALYDGIGSGTAVSDLTSNGRWPRDPSSERQMPLFEGINNRASNFGAALRGYLIPPQTGAYTFWISSDDSSDLYYSPTTNMSTLTRIALVNGYTGPRQWTKFSSQQSGAITLQAGQAYYFEARMKEGGGEDSVAVAWRGPATANLTNVIPGQFLAPAPLNYIPHATGFSTTLHQNALTGAAVGVIAVTDVNAQDTHRFQITSGNSAGLFTIDSSAGVIRVVDQAALAAAPTGNYFLQVSVTDSGSPPLSAAASATINLVGSSALAGTSPRREIWSDIGGGTAVSDLTNNAAFPGRPTRFETLSSFASPVDTADNYGSRIRAYLTPTNTGTYRFFIASDDASSLLLSTSDNPTNAVRIAYVSGWTDENAWTANASQISALRTLTAGVRYYIEALHKEGGGGDHVEVGWAGPGIVDTGGQPATNVIAGSFLTPFDLNYPPRINNQTLPVFATIPNGTAVGRVSALDSQLDALTFQIIDGNTNNMFAIDPASGVISVLDNALIADGSLSVVPLTVMVQDSGCGGLFPREAAQAIVSIVVQSSLNVPYVWTGAETNNQWTSAGNWGGAVPPENARLTFGYPWQQRNVNNALTAVSWLQFTNGGFNLSGNPLLLTLGLTNRGDNTVELPTALTAAQTWQNSSGTLSIVGGVTNNGYLLTIQANSDIRVSGQISGTGGLTRTGTGRLLMEGRHTYTGPTIITAASGTTTALQVGAQDLDLSGSDVTLVGRMDLATHDATIGALIGNGLVFGNDLNRTLTVGASGRSGAFSGTIQNSASGSGMVLNLVKEGVGTQVLSGANTFSGVVGVLDGMLLAANAAALGNASGGTIVANGGTLALSNNITIAAEPLTLSGTGFNNSGALRNESGVNNFNGPLSFSGPSTIRAAGTRLTLGGSWNTLGNTHALTFDAAPSAAVFVMNGISGGGALAKTGTGMLSMYGTNTYTGSTSINEGTLLLAANASISRSAGIVLNTNAVFNVAGVSGGWVLVSGQYLQGSGIVSGSVRIAGSIYPGITLGTLTVNGQVVLQGTVVMEIRKLDGLPANDVLACTSSLTPGGILTVVNIGAEAFTAGDSFKLFDALAFGAGAFDTLNLPALPADLRWDTSKLYVDGTLRVEPAVPPSLAVAFSGGTLTLAWPGEYSSYVLEGQTNEPGQGLVPLWFPVPGVVSNSISIPVDLLNGSAFYRLGRP